MKLLALSLAFLLSVTLMVSTNAEPQDLNACAACEFFTGALLGQLGADRNPQHIATRLDNLCNNVPSFMKPSCQNWVDQYKPAIIRAITTGATAASVCRQINICQGPATQIAFEEYAKFANDSGVCDVCTFIVTEVIAQLNHNETQANIVATLHWICDFLPLGQQMCKDFVSENLPDLIKYLSEGDSAAKICNLLEYCPTEQVDIEAVRAKIIEFIHTRNVQAEARDRSRKCEMCRYLEDATTNMIESGSSVAEVATELPSLCTFLPPYADECQVAVEAYGRYLINALYTKTSSTKESACVAIAICKA